MTIRVDIDFSQEGYTIENMSNSIVYKERQRLELYEMLQKNIGPALTLGYDINISIEQE